MLRSNFHRFSIPITFKSSQFIRTMSSQAQFTKNLPTREPSAEESKIIQDILSLYQCNPSEKAYSHYTETAQFRDPVSIAKGKSQIQAQFNGMPKIFSSSETQEMKVLSNEGVNKSDILLDLTQKYTFKVGGAEKTVRSLVTLQREGENGLITLHEEEWDHEPNKYALDGFLGKIQEARKRAGAVLIDKFVSSDPNKASKS